MVKKIVLNIPEDFYKKIEEAAEAKMLTKTAYVRTELAKIIRGENEATS